MLAFLHFKPLLDILEFIANWRDPWSVRMELAQISSNRYVSEEYSAFLVALTMTQLLQFCQTKGTCSCMSAWDCCGNAAWEQHEDLELPAPNLEG